MQARQEVQRFPSELGQDSKVIYLQEVLSQQEELLSLATEPDLVDFTWSQHSALTIVDDDDKGVSEATYIEALLHEVSLIDSLQRDFEIEEADIDQVIEEDDYIKLYRITALNYPVLDRESEHQLFESLYRLNSAIAGDPEQRETERLEERNQVYDTIINHNLRLVFSIASRFSEFPIEFADAIQVGNLGLLKAIEEFDYTRGTKFSTFAFWKIWGPIYRSSRKRIQQSYNDEWHFARNRTSIDAETNQAEASIVTDKYLSYLSDIYPRGETVLRMLYGLDTGVSMTSVELAKKEGCSNSNILSIRDRAFRHIRRRFKLNQKDEQLVRIKI